MDEVKKRMDMIKKKRSPSSIEVYKLVRYLINVENYSEGQIFSELEWNRDTLDRAIKRIKHENARPRPKRYYVSLKEPLDDVF